MRRSVLASSKICSRVLPGRCVRWSIKLYDFPAGGSLFLSTRFFLALLTYNTGAFRFQDSLRSLRTPTRRLRAAAVCQQDLINQQLFLRRRIKRRSPPGLLFASYVASLHESALPKRKMVCSNSVQIKKPTGRRRSA